MSARLTEDGLVTGDGHRLPWDQILALDYTRRGAWLATTRGLIWVKRAVAAEVERRIEPWRADLPDPGCPLPLAPDERITLRTDTRSRATAVMALVPTIIGAGLCYSANLPVFGLVMLCFGLAATLLSLRECSDWQLDAEGISAGPWPRRRVAWRDVLAYRESFGIAGPAERLLVLQTRSGPLRLRPNEASGAAIDAFRRWHEARRAARPEAVRYCDYFASTQARRGLAIGPDGLWSVWRHGARHAAWSEVQSVAWEGQSSHIAIAGGRGVGLREYLAAAELATLVDQRLGGAHLQPARDTTISAEVIERWLGVEPGGAVSARGLTWSQAGQVLLAAIMLVTLWFAVSTGRAAGLWYALFLLPQALGILALSLSVAGSVRADAQGLTVRRWRRRRLVPWSAVMGVRYTGFSVSIDTQAGEVLLGSSAAAKAIAGAAERVLEARSLGIAAPSTGPLPDTALSRLTGSEPTEDRALSLAERNEDA